MTVAHADKAVFITSKPLSRCCIFLFWPQYGTLPTATRPPFLVSSALSSDIQEKIPFFIKDFLPWHFIHRHPPVEERCCWGLRSASLEITMQLDWSSPWGCRCPQSALRLTSALPSHYSPRAVGGQSYQVEWCYKINWMLRRGKCWRWWTEESPRWELQLFPETSKRIGMRIQGQTAGLLAGAAIGIKHERPDQSGASLIRHFLQAGDTTCARPVRLSEIGMDTPECTEVVSELQMEATHGGTRRTADNHSIQHRAELLNQDFFQRYTEIEQQTLGVTKGFLAIILTIYVIAFDLKMRPNYESYNISALSVASLLQRNRDSFLKKCIWCLCNLQTADLLVIGQQPYNPKTCQ